MPPLTRWFIRIAFLYLVVGLLLGLLLALRPILPLPPFLTGTIPVYFHLFLVGWLTQLIFGTVFWLFPPAEPPRPELEARLGWSALLLLNAGLLFRVVGEPAVALRPGSPWGWLLVISAICQWVGGLAYVILVWPRARERARAKGRREEAA
ncbi:MAG: hypothetical protein GX579_16815 [Chloroflexi bacterium]|jgi:hypothetical protein|nr:hypothetical protein [Chloroflexota bacterium]